MVKNISSLEKIIGIKFKNKKLLLKSMTHKSFDSKENNEQLEFLGDRILGLVISKKILKMYPDDKVGSLDKKLASLVNKKKCLEISNKIKLEPFIITGNSKGKVEDKILADACESIIGAIYLEHGLIVVEKFILNLWKENLNSGFKDQIDSKTKLQEYSLKNYKSLPIYKLISITGPHHKPYFKVAVRLKNSNFVNSIGYSKKEAEQKAATILLKKIGI